MRVLAGKSSGDLPLPMLYSVDEIASMFSVSSSTVKRWIVSKKLKGRLQVRSRSSVYRVVALPELLEFLDVYVPIEGTGSQADRIMQWHRNNGIVGRLSQAKQRAKLKVEQSKGEASASTIPSSKPTDNDK